MFWDNTPVQLFDKGGFAMWPLLVCSVLGLALIVDRCAAFLWYGGNFRRLVTRLKTFLVHHRVEDARLELQRWNTPVARLAETYLDHLHLEPEKRKEIAEREGSQQLIVLETRLNWLGMIAQVAPMIGLLGTVTGLVGAFHQIELKDGVVQPADLAGGIWEALITTVFGLVVAIPCVAVFQLLDARAAKTALSMEWMLSYLDQWFAAKTPARAAEHEMSGS